MLIPKQEIEAAAARIRPHIAPTPLIRADYFSRSLGAGVYFKMETLQPTHSFKVRGAFSALTRLDESQRARGIVTASGGNHGLAVAHAASKLGIPASIYLPESATEAKLGAIRRYAVETLIHGKAWDDAHALACALATETGRQYVHPFDHPDVMAGQATLAVEILQQLPQADVIVASIGGGGLISGILSAVRQLSPRTRVYGVETVGADCMHQSLQAGRIVELPEISSIAETLGARRTGDLQFEIVSAHVTDLVTLPDESALRALIALLEHEKLLVEPAASCSLAALLDGKIPTRVGENIVVVLCGANVGLNQVLAWQERFLVA